MQATLTVYIAVAILVVIHEAFVVGFEEKSDLQQWMIILMVGTVWPIFVGYRTLMKLSALPNGPHHSEQRQAFKSLDSERIFGQDVSSQPLPYEPMSWLDVHASEWQYLQKPSLKETVKSAELPKAG
jgi:hypothetical protein